MKEFLCYFLPYKEFYKEYETVLKKKSVSKTILLICSLVLTLAIIPSVIWIGFYVMVSFHLIGVILLICWLLTDSVSGGQKYKSIFYSNYNTKTDYIFSEENFKITCGAEESVLQYSAIKWVAETKNLFVLQTASGRGILIYKTSFSQENIEKFRYFIFTKTQLPIKSYNLRVIGKPKAVQVAIALLITSAVLVSSFIGNDIYSNSKKVVKHKAYQITVAEKFKKEKDDVYDLYLKNELDDTAVRVYSETKEQISESTGYKNLTAYDYAEKFIASTLVNPTDMVKTIDDSHYYVALNKSINNETYNLLDVVTLSGDTYWVTEFSCFEEDWETYSDEFIKYAKTIK